jgi:hypothetical protein
MKHPITYFVLSRIAAMKDDLERFLYALKRYGIIFEGYECDLPSGSLSYQQKWDSRLERMLSEEELLARFAAKQKDFHACKNYIKLAERFFFRQMGENKPLMVLEWNPALQTSNFYLVKSVPTTYQKFTKIS